MDIVLYDAVESLLESLQPPELAKVLRTLDLLEEFGTQLGLPHSRHLSDGLLELRVRGKREIRIFFLFPQWASVFVARLCKKDTEDTRERVGQSEKAKG